VTPLGFAAAESTHFRGGEFFSPGAYFFSQGTCILGCGGQQLPLRVRRGRYREAAVAASIIFMGG